MRAALAEAVVAAEAGEVPVGAVLMYEGRVLARAGRIVETAYLMPDDPIPSYAVKVGEDPIVIPYDDPIFEDDKPTGLLVATIVTGVASAGLFGAAGFSEAKFKNLNTADGQLDAWADRANGLSLAAGVGAAATAGMGAVVVIRW